MPSLKKAVLTDMLQELIDSKIIILPIIISGKWYEIDTPQDLDFAKKKIYLNIMFKNTNLFTFLKNRKI